MFSITLSTFLVLSAISNPHAVLGQATNTSSTGSSASAPGSAAGPMALASGLSTGCQAAAGSLLTSDFGACSNIMGLVSVIGASGSVIVPMTNWISSICSAAPCSPDTLRQANQSVSTGCSSDILKGSSVALALQTIVSNYNGAKDLLCTQYVANSTFCIPSILNNVQTASGQNITVSEVTALLSGSMTSAGQSFANVPSGVYCNDCGHALATQSAVFMAASPGQPANSSSATGSISATCGASFADGKIPSSVRIASKSVADNAKNAAPRLAASFLLPIAFATASFALFV